METSRCVQVILPRWRACREFGPLAPGWAVLGRAPSVQGRLYLKL